MTTAPRPARVLVFGASGHVGRPMADHIARQADGPTLRLATSTADKVAALRADFPDAEVVVANYLDLPSMTDAFDGVDAAFVLTPDFTMDERRAMTNVAAAAHHHGRAPHIVKLTGCTIGINRVEDLSFRLQYFNGSSLQYQQARAVLDASGLPVSYLNSFAYFMDDLISVWLLPLVIRHKLSAPFDRVTTFVDTRDLGEAGANLLMGPHDREHDGYSHHVTGTERIRFSDVAPLMSKSFGIEIEYEDDPDAFLADVRFAVEDHFGAGAAEYFLDFSLNEQVEEPLFIVTDVLKNLLGREPRNLADWIEEHKDLFFDAGLGADLPTEL